MSSLVALAGGLSTYAKLASNRRPANSKRDGLVDARLEFSLSIVASVPDQLDPLKNLSGRSVRKLLRAARSFGYRFARSRPQSPALLTGSAPGLSHTSSVRLTLPLHGACRKDFARLATQSVGPRWRRDGGSSGPTGFLGQRAGTAFC